MYSRILVIKKPIDNFDLKLRGKNLKDIAKADLVIIYDKGKRFLIKNRYNFQIREKMGN